MEVIAKAKFIRLSIKKARPVINEIRGKNAALASVILKNMSVTVLYQCFILHTMSMSCRIEQKYGFIHIPFINPPSYNMKPPHTLWRIHIRPWRIHYFERLLHLRIMNTTTSFMNPPHVFAPCHSFYCRIH